MGMPNFLILKNPFNVLRFFPKRNLNLYYAINDFSSVNKSLLSNIKIPTILYYGDKDRWAPLWIGKRINKVIPNSRLLVAHGRNHQWLGHKIDETELLKEIESFYFKKA